uniref:NADH dehydrogenase subunit 2 n=1 Tax=Metoecus javanus TaxID=2873716 RepID=UPI001E7DF991|nr:NADH dehydrogenase subunit 2 [Metoecus javanus]QZQ52999.1 NADH dehydrogenase subunit 2 [Metoecus cf. javanus JL-2021a]UOI84441.1 NADH dehydrogenase subunit 2 [Metoecus javanus]UOI84454.1 NADH dehydrogenase subunit 2 [Metoecus javanus]
MKFYKILFSSMMVLGTLMAISSYSWFSMWMGLEINLLSIIPLMSSTKNMLSSEATIKYFLTQTMASLILIFSIINMLLLNENIAQVFDNMMMMTLNSSLLTKLGAAPFHFWFPEVMEGLSWLNCLILLTWQKIAPMILIMNNKMNNYFMITIIVFSLMVSTLMGLNQTSLRKILSFSSINHIAWMLSAQMASHSIWLIYFLVYFLTNCMVIMLFQKTNIFYMKQLIMALSNNKKLKFTFMLNFFSLSGLPPFLGFLPKWLTINWLMLNNQNMLSMFLILFTLIFMYIYTRIIFSALVIQINESKIILNSQMKWLLNFMNLFTMMSIFICTVMFNLF